MDGQLRLQLGDALTGRSQLGLLGSGRTGNLPGVDAVLATPDVDRLLADAEKLGDLGDLAAGLDQIKDPAAELERIAAGHDGLRRLLDGQFSSNPTPSNPGRTMCPASPASFE